MPVPHSQISRAAPADCLPPSTRRGTSGGRLEEASGAPGTPDKNAQLAVSEKKVLTVAGVFDLFSDLADDVSISFWRMVDPINFKYFFHYACLFILSFQAVIEHLLM